MRDFTLNEFTDLTKAPHPIKLDKIDSDICIKYLKSMLKIRVVEQKLAKGREEGIIGGPVHLGVGQEAIAVGMSSCLRFTDRVFGAHRSHSHILALGSDVRKLFSEVLGRETGHCKGMGGSMHLWDQSVGFYGSVPIVAGTVPLAVGAGLAAKMQGTGDIAVVYFGDGAIEEGVVHESLNFARIQSIPVIFVVENNLFASHMHISQRQPKNSTARFAYANDIDYRVVDGNDVIAMQSASAEIVDNARKGNVPGFIEAVTYRWYGHVDWREDIDVGVSRSQKDVISWRSRDPIKRLANAMIQAGIWSEKKNEEMTNELEFEINESWEKALDDPYPKQSALLSRVYSREEI